MTEIKVFGKPKRKIIALLEQSLKKLDLDTPKIYLAFARNENEIVRYREKFGRVSIADFKSEEKRRYFESLIKKEFPYVRAMYVTRARRKESFPPVIFVNLGSKAPEINWEESILHETLHLKSEVMGWMEITDKANVRAEESFYLQIEDIQILAAINNYIDDFFGDEVACQYGFANYVLRRKRSHIHVEVKSGEKLSEEERIELFEGPWIDVFEGVIHFAFTINLPPSYPGREGEQKLLEKELSPVLRYIPEYIDFQKLALLPSQIKMPPEERNLLKIYGKIFVMYNDFLNHFV